MHAYTREESLSIIIDCIYAGNAQLYRSTRPSLTWSGASLGVSSSDAL